MRTHTMFKNSSAKCAIALSVAVALSACSSDDDDDVDILTEPPGTDISQAVTATLDADQEIPAPVGVPAGASGSATVRIYPIQIH